MRSKQHKILDCKLIKVEKKFNQTRPSKFFYNIELQDINEPLLLETEQPLEPGLVGLSIKYKLNEENEVSEFVFV